MRFGAAEQLRRRVTGAVERNGEADFRQRPLLAQAFIKGTGDLNRLVVGEQRLDLPRELSLVFGDQVSGIPGDRIRDALVEQRLLAFEHKLLVAQRADREPGQHEARHEHRQHKYKGDFLHRSVRSSALPRASSSTGQ